MEVEENNEYYLDRYNIFLKTCNEVYEPAEDSFLVVDNIIIPQQAKIIVEVGCGSGIISLALGKKYPSKRFIISDISIKAAQYAHYNVKMNKLQGQIDVVCSNTIDHLLDFSPDMIIWNPPYLPEEKQFFSPLEKKMLFGGKNGYETVYKFIEQMKKKKIKTTFVTIFSSIAINPEELKKKRKKEKFEIIKEEKLPFESLFLVKIEVE